MSARHRQSSFRDQTDEFFNIVESLRRSNAPAANNVPYGSGRSDVVARREDPRSALINQSEFSRRASKIGLAIHQTSQKLSKLAKLAKRTSVFDDPTQEIQELTVVIKQEISGLNTALLDLQVVRNTQNDEGNNSRDTTTHSATVVDNLKNRLMDTTKEFKDVLTMRTEEAGKSQIFTVVAAESTTITATDDPVATTTRICRALQKLYTISNKQSMS